MLFSFLVILSTFLIVQTENTSFAESNSEIFQLVSGGNSNCLLDNIETEWCWGDNSYGQLGIGSQSNSSQLLKVLGDHQFKFIDLGVKVSCGIDLDDDGWCWGTNVNGSIGNGSSSQSVVTTPVSISGDHKFLSISVGYDFTCGINLENKAFCWGFGISGQIGNGAFSFPYPDPVPVVGNLKFQKLSTGEDFACGLTLDEKLYCWGNGMLGQMAKTNNRYSAPQLISSNLNFVEVSTTDSAVCGVTEQSNLYCWGYNLFGQVGVNQQSGTIVSQPTLALENSGIIKLSGGADHFCALTDEGAVSCWGKNDNSQATLSGRYTEYINVPKTINFNKPIKDISTGANHTCILTIDEELYCWGNNQSQQLGTNQPSSYEETPVLIDTSVISQGDNTDKNDNESDNNDSNNENNVGDGIDSQISLTLEDNQLNLSGIPGDEVQDKLNFNVQTDSETGYSISVRVADQLFQASDSKNSELIQSTLLLVESLDDADYWFPLTDYDQLIKNSENPSEIDGDNYSLGVKAVIPFINSDSYTGSIILTATANQLEIEEQTEEGALLEGEPLEGIESEESSDKPSSEESEKLAEGLENLGESNLEFSDEEMNTEESTPEE